ncbi:DUF1772 domain-containing protein [Mesorhizobium sp.]|uniref:DUF1772 domain-containing protein n=1 Tax=Mesorhizobium sp. TaxID=1871066 RepID=UPI0025EA3E0B|nr:DUF1772 domain-containing protein [Mesorhizobium sp.]
MRAFMIVTLLLVAITMALSLAHALELPGKLRLKEATYKSVQAIYYPGFTVGGFAEIGGIIALAILLYLTPYPGARFWWTLTSLVFLVAEHATYWLVTHPVNNFWVQDIAVSKPAATFFFNAPSEAKPRLEGLARRLGSLSRRQGRAWRC